MPEKYDVVSLTHKVQVEYGNVGVDFKYVTREGFGWMNASYQIGLTLLNTQMRRALGTCTDPDTFFAKALERQNMLNETQMRRRKSSVAAAKAITQNGLITAAITHIDATTTTGIYRNKTSS